MKLWRLNQFDSGDRSASANNDCSWRVVPKCPERTIQGLRGAGSRPWGRGPVSGALGPTWLHRSSTSVLPYIEIVSKKEKFWNPQQDRYYVLFWSTQRELKSRPLRQQRLQLLLADWLVLPPLPDVKMTSSWDIIQSTRWPQRYLQVNSTHPEASKPSGKVLAACLAGNQAASRSPLSLTWVLGRFWEAETVHGWDLTSFRHFREQETWAEVQVFSKTERYVSKALGAST